MASAVESVIAERWLNATLKGDTALMALVGNRVYGEVAPENAPLPHIIFMSRSGTSWRVMRPQRLGSTLEYVVKVVGKGASYVALNEAATRIAALLDGKRGAAEGGHVLSSAHIQPVAYPETSQGVQYRHLGGLYRLNVQLSPA